MKPNRPYLRIFNTLLILAAYGYLAYRLIIFDDYSSFLSAFRTSNIGLWLTLIATLLLMPLNVEQRRANGVCCFAKPNP